MLKQNSNICAYIVTMIVIFPLMNAAYSTENPLPDEYETSINNENDDHYTRARSIWINDKNPQKHNFHHSADEDWLVVKCIEGKNYTILAKNLGQDCWLKISLFASNDLSESLNFALKLHFDTEVDLTWSCRSDAIYYIQFSYTLPDSFGPETQYDAFFYMNGLLPDNGTIKGFVRSAFSNKGIPEYSVNINGLSAFVNRFDTIGYYSLSGLKEGNVTCIIESDDYFKHTEEFYFKETYIGKDIIPMNKDFYLINDIYSDRKVSLSEIVLGLRTMTENQNMQALEKIIQLLQLLVQQDSK